MTLERDRSFADYLVEGANIRITTPVGLGKDYLNYIRNKNHTFQSDFQLLNGREVTNICQLHSKTLCKPEHIEDVEMIRLAFLFYRDICTLIPDLKRAFDVIYPGLESLEERSPFIEMQLGRFIHAFKTTAQIKSASPHGHHKSHSKNNIDCFEPKSPDTRAFLNASKDLVFLCSNALYCNDLADKFSKLEAKEAEYQMYKSIVKVVISVIGAVIVASSLGIGVGVFVTDVLGSGVVYAAGSNLASAATQAGRTSIEKMCDDYFVGNDRKAAVQETYQKLKTILGPAIADQVEKILADATDSITNREHKCHAIVSREVNTMKNQQDVQNRINKNTDEKLDKKDPKLDAAYKQIDLDHKKIEDLEGQLEQEHKQDAERDKELEEMRNFMKMKTNAYFKAFSDEYEADKQKFLIASKAAWDAPYTSRDLRPYLALRDYYNDTQFRDKFT